MNKKTKKFFTLIISFLFIIGISTSFYLYISWFDFEDFFSEISLNIYQKIWIVLIIYFFRNYLFIPSTIIILFAWFFLQDFLITLFISILWVSFWIVQTYFVWYIFWEDLKNHKNNKMISKYNTKIQKDGWKVIFFGSFFPIIPVDILYYSAWFVKYHFIKAYFAGIIWEMPLIILYVYLWKEASKYTHLFIYIWWSLVIWFILFYSIKKLFYRKK